MPLIQNLFVSSLPHSRDTHLYSLIETNFHPLTSAPSPALPLQLQHENLVSHAERLERNPKAEETDRLLLSLFLLLHLRSTPNRSSNQRRPSPMKTPRHTV